MYLLTFAAMSIPTLYSFLSRDLFIVKYGGVFFLNKYSYIYFYLELTTANVLLMSNLMEGGRLMNDGLAAMRRLGDAEGRPLRPSLQRRPLRNRS